MASGRAFAARWPANPILTPLLIGLGVDELSAAPPVVPQVKYIVRRLKLTEAQELAEFALQCESGVGNSRQMPGTRAAAAPSLFENKVTRCRGESLPAVKVWPSSATAT